jgi:UDP-N-acetylglucosamine 4,6-dehydratase/5-epimerase
MGSRGSVIPFFLSQAASGKVTLTHTAMTRFMISLAEGVELVWRAFDDMVGGETYVRKIPSMKLVDIARACAPDASQEVMGIRPGEKIHEQMIGVEDALYTYEYPEYYKILPAINGWSADPARIKDGIRVPDNFCYSSETNPEWMSIDALRDWIEANRAKMGNF